MVSYLTDPGCLPGLIRSERPLNQIYYIPHNPCGVTEVACNIVALAPGFKLKRALAP